jgi:hypothetical protein
MKRKKTPEELAWERESAERLAKLRELVRRGWADLEEKRRQGYHLEHPAWGPPPERG